MNKCIKNLTKEQFLNRDNFIIQPIYGYEDDNGNKVHDFEEMQREFDERLSELKRKAK